MSESRPAVGADNTFIALKGLAWKYRDLPKVATAWYGKQVKKIGEGLAPLPTFHPSGRELTAKAVSSAQGFRLGLGF